MKAVLLALVVIGAALAVAEPAAAGCPPPEEGYPCDPMPYDPLPGQCDPRYVKTLLYCYL